MDPKQMKVILQKYPETKPVENDDNDLQTEGFYNANKIFITTMYDMDNNKSFQESTVYRVIENFRYVISLHIQLPDTSKGNYAIFMQFCAIHSTRSFQIFSMFLIARMIEFSEMLCTIITKYHTIIILIKKRTIS